MPNLLNNFKILKKKPTSKVLKAMFIILMIATPLGLFIAMLISKNKLKASIVKEKKLKTQEQETKSIFLATLTHDLRSPLIAEQRALEAILDKKFGTSLEDFSEYLKDIYKINDELLRIVNNILSVYHYESGKAEIKPETINVKELVLESVREMQHLAKDENSEIITNVQHDLPEVFADKEEIKRVITNLISNAIKYNKKGTYIEVKACQINNEIEFSVHDNGKGIPESERPNIFQRYPTTKRKIGTGLGLYLSKQIIDTHKGKIWFVCIENQGTTFYFTLPVKQD